jgi:hypothetical protein
MIAQRQIKSQVTRKGKVMTAMTKGKTLICLAAGISFVLSVSLWFGGDKDQGLFVGIWVPSILALGALVLSGNRR